MSDYASNSLSNTGFGLVSDTLYNLGLNSDMLVFGLNFKATTAPLPGFINKLRKNESAMDLDISCLLYDNRCNLIDKVWFKQLRDRSSAVRHQGDSINGKDRGEQALYEGPVDPEMISIRLAKLPEQVTHISFVLSSYYGQPLKQIQAGKVYISDDEGNLAFELNLTHLKEPCQALWIANLRREVDDWHLTVQNLATESNNLNKIASFISHELARSLPLASI